MSYTARGKISLAVIGVMFALTGVAIAQQNKDSVKIPDGLALSEFKGYEKWQVIGVSYFRNAERRPSATIRPFLFRFAERSR